MSSFLVIDLFDIEPFDWFISSLCLLLIWLFWWLRTWEGLFDGWRETTLEGGFDAVLEGGFDAVLEGAFDCCCDCFNEAFDCRRELFDTF